MPKLDGFAAAWLWRSSRPSAEANASADIIHWSDRRRSNQRLQRTSAFKTSLPADTVDPRIRYVPLKNPNIFVLMLVVALLVGPFSCGEREPNEQIDEGRVAGNVYTSREVGWTMEIPKGWSVLTKDRLESMERKGLEALHDVVDQPIDLSGLKSLISLQKDRSNVFQSTSERFVVEREGEWEETDAALKDVIISAYQSRRINAKATKTRLELIDGLQFHTYTITLYGKTGGVVLKQIMYSRLINGYDFAANIAYTDDRARDEMLIAWTASKFSIR